MHKYFGLDTTGGEGGELRAFARLEAFDGFDQVDCANTDEILWILTVASNYLTLWTTWCNRWFLRGPSLSRRHRDFD